MCPVLKSVQSCSSSRANIHTLSGRPQVHRSPPEGNRWPSLSPKSTTSRAWSRRPCGPLPAAWAGAASSRVPLGRGRRSSLPGLLAACGGDGDTSTQQRQRRWRQADRHRHRRLQRLRRGAEEGLRRRLRRLRGEPAGEDQGQHGRPQHLPGADQQLPAGQPGRRLHLVRRLPDAVLRRARAWPATSATSGTRSAPTSATRSRRRRPATTASSTSCRSTTTRGSLMYRKSVWAEKGYTAPKTMDELKPSAPDEEGRPRPRSPSPTRTAGRRWAPSTSSTCASTATTSTSA